MSVSLLIVSGVALVLAAIGCFAGFTAIALVVGLKNSTHTIQWKPVEEPTANSPVDDFDPFANEELAPNVEINPNKRTKLQVVKEDFGDLDNPEITSNEW
jgi:hypothetical protein